MNKTQLQEALRARGIPFNESATKADLEALLKAAESSKIIPVAPETPVAPIAPIVEETATEDRRYVPVVEKTTNEDRHEEEAQIIAKVMAGLTREQAIEVIANQKAHDEALEG